MAKSAKPKQEEKGAWGVSNIFVYLIVFALPLFFLPFGLFPTSLSKQVFVGTLLLASAIYILVKFITSGKAMLPRGMMLWAPIALFLSVLVSAVFSQARAVSFLAGGVDSVFWVGMYVLAFFVGFLFLNSKKSLTIGAISYVSGSFLLGLFAVLQLSGVLENIGFGLSPAGSAFNMGFLLTAALSAVVIFLLVAEPKSKKVKITLWSLVAFFAFLILQINLWEMWLSLGLTFVLAAIIISYGMIKRIKSNPKPLFMSLLVVSVSILALFISFYLPTVFSINDEVTLNVPGTLDVSKEALEGFRWAVGTGPGTFPYNFLDAKDASFNQTPFWASRFEQGYSMLMSVFSTWGILGTVAFLFSAFIFYKTLAAGLIKTLKQKARNKFGAGLGLGALAASFVLFLSTVFYRPNVVSITLLFLIAGAGVAVLSELDVVQKKKFEVSKSPGSMMASLLTATVLISSALGAVYFLGRNYTAQIYASSAIKEYNATRDLEGPIGKMDKAIEINPGDNSILNTSTQFLVLRLSEIAANEDLSNENIAQLFGLIFQQARNVAQTATELNPKEPGNWLQLGELHEQVIGLSEGAENSAIDAYEKAGEIDPVNPQVPYVQGRVYVAVSDVVQAQISGGEGQGMSTEQQQQLLDQRTDALNKAEEKLNQSIELKPDYTDARILLANTYIKLGNNDSALEQASAVEQLGQNNSDALFKVGVLYWEMEVFESARDNLERAISLSGGTFGDARYFLGLAYHRLGNIEEAIGQFETLAQDNPEDESISTILQNLREGNDPLEGLGDAQTEDVLTDSPEEQVDPLVQ